MAHIAFGVSPETDSTALSRSHKYHTPPTNTRTTFRMAENLMREKRNFGEGLLVTFSPLLTRTSVRRFSLSAHKSVKPNQP